MPDLPATLPAPLPGLLAALVAGLVIGLERGWRDREAAEGTRVAGLRTFTLVGLLGGVLASLLPAAGPWPLAAGLLGIAVLNALAYRETVQRSGRLSATSAVAVLLTYGLGALAASGMPIVAVALAVVIAVTLNLRNTLHAWLRRVEARELNAALQMLVLSVVVLPLLPDQSHGPYGAWNPYRLWWAVVLVAGLSLSGHVAMRWVGAQRGVLWTGLLGGLASSTATTLALARQVREQPALLPAAAAGALAASAVSFVRLGVLVFTFAPALGWALLAPLLGAAALLLVAAFQAWRGVTRNDAPPPASELPPFDLGTALGFGLYLGLTAVLLRAGRDWLGEGSVVLLSGLSGLADMDAVAITLARLTTSANGLPADLAVWAFGAAVLANMGTKAALAWSAGGAAFGRRIAAAYGLALGVGALAALARG